MMPRMRYRLALDLGSTSLGWALIRLDAANAPCAIIKAGVRIFSDGRNPKDGSSLAVTRRDARAMRRRRDRLLKRKARMMAKLIEYGFFPASDVERKSLEKLDPYALRAKGLDQALTPSEFARALFHINQRRGFKSNRKTDKKDDDSGALKQSISKLRQALQDDQCRTVGEWLHKRNQSGLTVRARYRQTPFVTEEGKKRIDKRYDLYIDRRMIEDEFDALWAKQSELSPALFHQQAGRDLKDVLLHQRPLKPVIPGRCTLLPDEQRAPLALPSQQRFRIYQEVNNLRILRGDLKEQVLSLDQRDKLVAALERHSKRSFLQIKKLLGLSGQVQFNIEDPKRQELKGNTTSAILGDKKHFGDAWFAFDEGKQDAIVMQLVKEESEAALIAWIQAETGVDEARAEVIANAGLPEGYGSLCGKALERIVPALRAQVITYDKAVLAAGFDHHSKLNHHCEVPGRTFKTGETHTDKVTGEIQDIHAFYELPYYGEFLGRHVGFGSGDPSEANLEKRFGKIPNPTVHVGLNQVRIVVNALIKRYGHPAEAVIEVATELKRPSDHRPAGMRIGKIGVATYRRYCPCAGCVNVRQSINQERNSGLRQIARQVLGAPPSDHDMEKMRLWKEMQEMNGGVVLCPYSGEILGVERVLSPEVEVDHILPHSRTLDDGLANKVLCIREANRIKKERTPAEAKDDFVTLKGWRYDDILLRVSNLDRSKRFRFGDDAMQKWLGEHKTFLARALNDTRYLSRVAGEYLALICPRHTTAIPGRMTSLLRQQFGLDDILGLKGLKNRNDHRHHAVDACVIGVTDQGMLQRFSQASASAREKQLDRLVEQMPTPWPTYYDHCKRAVNAIWVSHKPDHGHEGAMHNDTAYGLIGGGRVGFHKMVDDKRTYIEDNLKVLEFSRPTALKPDGSPRHGWQANGEPRPYKGYKGDSNYCIEIVRNDKGKWEGEVISTFEAYQIVRRRGLARLRDGRLSLSGKPLVMRLMIDDVVRLEIDKEVLTGRVAWVKSNTQIAFAAVQEANTDARARDNEDQYGYVTKTAGVLQKLKARRVTISPIGELRDPGFKG